MLCNLHCLITFLHQFTSEHFVMTDRRYTYHPSKFVSSIKPSDSGYGGSLGSGNSQSSASVVNLREKRLRNQHTISEDFTDDRVVRKRQLMALDKVLCGGISKAANKSRSDRTQKPNTELLGRVLGDVKATSSSDMPGVDFEFVSSEIEDPSRPRLSNRVTTYVPGHRDRPGLKSSRPKKMAFRLGRISDDESVASDIGHQDRPRPKSSRPKTKKFQLGSDSDDGLMTSQTRRSIVVNLGVHFKCLLDLGVHFKCLGSYYGVGRDSGNDAGYGSRDTYVSDQYDEPPGGRIHKFKDPGGKPNIVGTPLDMRFI
ncbi:hypothetical protein QBC47DRAFT_357556 [Echria macrotheca]|uniref:Uncharacterized protein n=1 Tax=Echria macrotheca TaxID=438768 RepID=A0AAJ0FFC5_9PEZI|nr:hypothetical protein QBC47DRAFT_357556 [Echria macrotheca]